MSALQPPEALAELARVASADGPGGLRLATVELVREALCRWGTSPRADLRRYLRGLGSAMELDLEDPNNVLDDMVLLGELIQLQAPFGVIITPRSRFQVRVGTRTASLGVPREAGRTGRRHGNPVIGDVLRTSHVRWRQEDPQDGDDGLSLDEWFSWAAPIELLRDRCLDVTTREATIRSMGELWEELRRRLSSEGAPVSSDHEIVVLGGEPGDLVGSASDPAPRARWRRAAVDDGASLAARPVVGDRLRPAMVSVEAGDLVRVMDLPSWDALWWAAWARGTATGRSEVISCRGEEVHWSLPLPRSIQARIDALCVGGGSEAWSRTFADGETAGLVAAAAQRALGLP